MKTRLVNRKYHLHRKLRKANVSFCTKHKTIYLPVYAEIISSDIQELTKNYNYQIQLQIPL